MPETKLMEERPTAVAPQRRSRGRIVWLILGVLALMAALFAAGWLPRAKRLSTIDAEAQEEESSLPIVNVARVKRSQSTSQLLLPGNMTPVTEAYIYARASGYLKKRYVDIGDRVRDGQLMAEIDAPDLDQQVEQARASLSQSRAALAQTQAAREQAESQLRLTSVTLERWKTLVARGVLAKQEGDQKQADYDNASASVRVQEANIRAAQDNARAAEANLSRLDELKGFEKVKAPFAGVVTSRSVDLGALISGTGAGQGSPGSSEMFRVAQNSVLRIMVNVPQSYAPSIRVGEQAVVTLQESRRRKFNGTVTRTANALDPGTRTLLTEVQVKNSDGALLPGMYGQIQFVSERAEPPLLVPGDAVVVRSNGPQVAVVMPDSKIHFEPVDVGRDYGADVEVLGGLNENDRVVVNPSDSVQEGASVKVAQPKQGSAAKK